MDTLQAQKVNELVAEYNLPPEIVSRCVAADGLVDTEKLGIALQSREFAKSNQVQANQAQIQNLKVAYGEARDRGDHLSAMSIKRQVFELGGVV